MNALLGLVVIAGLLVGYNSLTSKKDAMSASSKIASFLNLTQAKQETANAENNVAGTDNAKGDTPPTVTEMNTDGSTAPPEAPAADTAPEASPAPNSTATSTPATTTPPSVAPTPVVAAKSASTYTVKDGDTYGCIAEKYYGSYENWTNVVKANPQLEGFSEYRLFVGAVLELPAMSADAVRPASTLCQ